MSVHHNAWHWHMMFLRAINLPCRKLEFLIIRELGTSHKLELLLVGFVKRFLTVLIQKEEANLSINISNIHKVQ